MAETSVASYQVKHIDGVMHLTLPGGKEVPVAPEKLRVTPPVIDQAE
jgi:hypothetical protein